MAVYKVPDIELSDIMMPMIDGTEMPDRLRNENPGTRLPVVTSTARFDISSKLSRVDKSSNTYILIPFDAIDLQSVLRNLIGLKRKLQESNVSVTLSGITDQAEPGPDEQLMRKMLCLIDANIDDDQFGIDEICDALGMSRAQIYRKFKSITDITPHNYLRSYRLQKAKQLLITKKFNVSEAAYRTGFKNVSHFSRIFTMEFSKHPSEINR
jgi:AraC-like DNA-binding protein